MLKIRNKKILLLGLGLHGGGVATAKWLLKKGAELVISDLREEKVLQTSLLALNKYKNVRYVLGEHREEDIKWADMVVKNPGVPRESKYIKLAKKLKKPVMDETSLFFSFNKSPVIAVTGTRGKSTTSALIATILKMENKKTTLAGNIATTPMLSIVDKTSPKNPVVLELSSWHLEGLSYIKKTPRPRGAQAQIAVITNLFPDHLNRYKSLKDYYNSKKEIFKYQSKDDILILNNDDPNLVKWASLAPGQVFWFGAKEHKKEGVFVKDKKIMTRFDNNLFELFSLDNLKIQGNHNISNFLAAILTAMLYGVRAGNILKALKEPIKLNGRQELVAEIKGVKYINDTTSTTPVAGIVALQRFGAEGKRLFLIAGGADKKLNYKQWANAAKKNCYKIFLLKGEASKKQNKALRGFKNKKINFEELSEIVKIIKKEAKKGDIVLFSPAAASFNLWKHEFDRGDDFKKAIK